jgi:hypothetical protein
MQTEPNWPADPLIDEVRERRRQIWEECGRDLQKLYERIQQLQEQHPEKLVKRPKGKQGRREDRAS